MRISEVYKAECTDFSYARPWVQNQLFDPAADREIRYYAMVVLLWKWQPSLYSVNDVSTYRFVKEMVIGDVMFTVAERENCPPLVPCVAVLLMRLNIWELILRTNMSSRTWNYQISGGGENRGCCISDNPQSGSC